MKKLITFISASLLLFGCSESYDDSALRSDLENLADRVTRLEELCQQMNTNISALQTIVSALQIGDYVIGVSPVMQDGKEVGYKITFAKSDPITIYHGKDGTDGKDGQNGEDGKDGADGADGEDGMDGSTPQIGVRMDTDGIYYWTLNGEWLTDDHGNKIKAVGTDGTDGEDGADGENGSDGENGQDGVDGITPKLKIEDGYWYISYNDGASWEQLGKATGEDGADGKDGDSIFKDVTEDDDNVYFTLSDDTVITIPKGDSVEFAIKFETTDIAILNGGDTKTISYTITEATENTIVRAIAQDGWKVSVNSTASDKGTISVTAPDPIVESEILVFANDGSYRTVMAVLNCMQGEITVADNSVEASADGGTQEIRVTTNMDYTVVIPEEAKSWLSTIETKSMREETVSLSVAPNDGIPRFATVTLEDSDGNVLQTVIIRQLGSCTEINVETKGGLESALAGYDYANIESLKITGVLNDVDFLFIYRMMPNLKDLDISEVNIPALPTKAFCNSTNVENLILPKTLTTIGEQMFSKSRLKTVVIQSGLETIETGAFSTCTSLISVKIPASVESIGRSAFRECTSLTSIEIPASVEVIDSLAFEGCTSLATVTFEPGSRLKAIAGGYSSFTYAYYGAFSYCTSLASIEIPASVEVIGSAAFKNCTSLATVTFERGSQLKMIAGGHCQYSDAYYNSYAYYGAFSGCTSLVSIEIPASVETIESTAFEGCTSLATVTFEPDSQLKTIAGGYYYDYYYGAFYGCTSLASIEIPASVETIESTAFRGCTSLATVTFESGSQLKTIGGGYSDSFHYYYYGAFYGCTSLTSIEIPASVETIEATAFKGCTSLVTVTFEPGSRLKTIVGGYYYLSSYSSYYYYGVFSDCTSLASIEIPASVETIGLYAFKGCTSLVTVAFETGSQLKEIERNSFAKLKNLKTVDMSACTQVESIEYDAFYNDSELRLVMIGTETPPVCGSSAFYGINPYSVLKVPSGCSAAYKSASEWKRFASITGFDE